MKKMTKNGSYKEDKLLTDLLIHIDAVIRQAELEMSAGDLASISQSATSIVQGDELTLTHELDVRGHFNYGTRPANENIIKVI